MNCLSWILLVRKRTILSFLACFLVSIVFLGSGNAIADNLGTGTTCKEHTYFTQGVHSDHECDKPDRNCLPTRNPGEPNDPRYPKWWISDWTMYRVFQNYDKFPPPYDSPPQGLAPNDYEVSYGTTYYDSTYTPKDGDGTGAMMEYYKKRCLPIFPLDNQYTCAFVSLGNKAYFLRYDDKEKLTNICLFSPHNHPPEADFIKHLPYNLEESTHVNNSLQAYSIRLPVKEGGDPVILFGYAFNKKPTPDSFDKTAEPFRHPQSFYFSGYPVPPANAPIVSQNYTNFRMEKPPSEIWSKVAEILPPNPGSCCLFGEDCFDLKSQLSKAQPSPSWDALTYSK